MTARRLVVYLSGLAFFAVAAACAAFPYPDEPRPNTETAVLPEGPAVETPVAEAPLAISSAVPTEAVLRCATYFRTSASEQMIQGTWTDDPDATASAAACFQYIDREILHQPGYAQPAEAAALTVVLIAESRHTYDLPDDIDMGKEFVASLFFPGATGTPITQLVICASYYLTPGIDDYIQGSWTDGNDDPSAVTSKQGCFDYMRAKILDEPYCAQGLGTDHVLLALLTEERHTFYLPADLDPEAELVAVAACTNVPPTTTATAFYGWTLTPNGPPGTITPYYGWTPTPGGPTATATPYVGWSATPTAGPLTLTAAALKSKTPTPPGGATATPTAYVPGTPAPPGGATISATAFHTKTPTPPGGATISATAFHTKTPTPPGGATISATPYFTTTAVPVTATAYRTRTPTPQATYP
ncbi:MAG TPA: hypothetical protein VJ160_04015 [Anaerolineales bacterium]|nr:hypothetical protein [Anaerolineales bacterium]